ncbi:hypothetical protein [Butyrivibrio sp. FCS006]|uniref:hypothetical protein n=1 Tax=Butyrivibrio sp. FCS006 TaxID=1280684 RepID=UPI00047A7A5D|nr:hypothetical protein [Butyrivibrio sp. FCS006]
MDNKIVLKGNRSAGMRTAIGAVSTSTIACAAVLAKGFIGNSLAETVILCILYVLAGTIIVFLVYFLTISKIVIYDEYFVIYRGLLRRKVLFSQISRCFLRGSVLTIYGGPSEAVINLGDYDNAYKLIELLEANNFVIEYINRG